MSEPMIEISALTKCFGRMRVLNDIRLRIQAGRITAIAGPNACGKTTLIKTVVGLVTPTSGRIRVAGREVGPGGETRAVIGYMPQYPDFPGNLRLEEILRLLEGARRRSAPAARELLEYFGLTPRLRQPFGQLSGGTKQKFAAVTALMFDPPLLILDEPTAGLDPMASVRFKELIRKKSAEGRTILLVSHVMPEIERLTEDFVFMVDGEIRYAGGMRELLRAEACESSLEEAVIRLLAGTGARAGAETGAMTATRSAGPGGSAA